MKDSNRECSFSSGIHVAFLFLPETPKTVHKSRGTKLQSPIHPSKPSLRGYLSVLDDGGVEALGVRDGDRLDEGVELLLGALLIVTLAADADAETEWDTLDTGFPYLLVQLGVEADILGAL